MIILLYRILTTRSSITTYFCLKILFQASTCFIKAVKLEKAKRRRVKPGKAPLDRDGLPLPLDAAVDGLNSLVGTLVPRWHFRMLNDATRNAKFADAIVKAVRRWKRKKREGKPLRVLDIGAGTGLLSMVAAREGNLGLVLIFQQY